MTYPVKSIVWNRTERRLRLPWRLLAAIIVFGVLTFGAQLLIQPFLLPVFIGLHLEPFGRVGRLLLLQFVQLFQFFIFAYVVGRFVDRRIFSDFGFHLSRAWWLDLGFGLVLGWLLMSSIFVVELAAGWIRITGYFQTISEISFVSAFLVSALLFVFVGISEELLLRGYLLTNLAEGFRWFRWITPKAAVGAAVICSSAIFGIGHIANPNATPTSTFVITLGGIMLASGYVLTGELGIPIGLHISWNFFQTTVYGFSVSGLQLPVTVVATEQAGPQLLTGGAFGPEAGLIGVGAICIGTIAVVQWVKFREGSISLCSQVWTPETR